MDERRTHVGNTRRIMHVPLCAAFCAIVCTAAAAAQTYPTRPVRMIVPIAPGGGQDFVARMIAQRLTTALGQQVIVDNRPGAGGVLGTHVAEKAPPDGYTLVVVVASYTAQPSLYTKLPYDPVKDLAPI